MEKKFQQEDIEDSAYHSNHDHHFYTIYDKYYLEQIQRLRLSLPWVILIFGLIGNILILIIFTQKLRRRNSNAFCFCALAISDSFALIFMLFRALLKTEILTNLNVTCKLIKFLYHFFLQTSSWCLMLLTLDRLIAVAFVFQYQTWCKKLHVVKIFIGIVIMVLLVNVHLLIFVNSFENKNPSSLQTGLIIDRNQPKSFMMQNDTKIAAYYKPIKTTSRPTTTTKPLKKSYVCNVSYELYPFYYKYFYKPWDIYHGVIYGAIPFLFIFISNCIIIYKLIKRYKKASMYKSNQFLKGSSSNNTADPFIKSFQLTVMLLTVAFTFLILTSPISIYMAFLYENLTSVRESKREFIKVILRYIGYINNAINFYLYFTTSNEFRKEVGQLCRCFLPKSKGGSSIYTACTTSTSLPDINIETKPRKKIEDETLKSFNTHSTQVEQDVIYNESIDTPENRKRVHQIRYDKSNDINNNQELKAFLNNTNDNIKITAV